MQWVSIAELFNLVMARDADVAELYRDLRGPINAVCRRIIGDAAVAEEVAQEAFLRVLQYRDALSELSLARALLSRIAINLSLNELRNRARRAVPDADIELFCSDESQEPNLDGRLLAEHLLSRAPARVRTTVRLYHIDGLEQQEVAEALGISRRTVVKRLVSFSKWARARLEAPNWKGEGNSAPPRNCARSDGDTKESSASASAEVPGTRADGAS